jgi:hypothetical protein
MRVAIIGAGPAGLFVGAGLALGWSCPGRGKSTGARSCPVIAQGALSAGTALTNLSLTERHMPATVAGVQNRPDYAERKS